MNNQQRMWMYASVALVADAVAAMKHAAETLALVEPARALAGARTP